MQLSLKKEWNNIICSNMDRPKIYYTKWSKSDKERQISYDNFHMRNLKKMIEMNLFTKQKQTHRLRNESGYDEGRGGCEDSEFRISTYVLLYLK